MSSTLLPYWLAAMLLPGIGSATVMQWLEHFTDLESLFSTSAEDLRALGMSDKHIYLLQHPNWSRVEKELTWINEKDQHLICYSDPDYPELLKEISQPPLVLYVHGDKTILSQRQIAMVGARNATPAGLELAEKFAYQLATADIVVTSGLALGIDAASHRGALAANGKTIGVMATGIKNIYPYRHRSLATQIIKQGGAVITEFPQNTPPHPTHFPRRNRIISGLSLGVLLVEAKIKSGSLITAKHAMDQNRDVFAIPGSINNHMATGCHYLIQQGAKLVTHVEDILNELTNLPETSDSTKEMPERRARSWPPDRLAQGCASRSQEHLRLASKNGPSSQTFPNSNESKSSSNKELTKAHHQLLAQIDYATTPFDVIVLRSGLTVGELSSMLLSLTLEGYVQSVVGGYIRL